MKLTKEQIESNSHISSEEIEKDIADTQREVNQYQKELDVLKGDMQRNKLPIYMLEGRISLSEKFIEQLKSILEYRHRATKALEAVKGDN